MVLAPNLEYDTLVFPPNCAAPDAISAPESSSLKYELDAFWKFKKFPENLSPTFPAIFMKKASEAKELDA